MRLPDFVLANVEPILVEWESFARRVWPEGATADPAELRDDAGAILRATVVDMQCDQTTRQQSDKSQSVIRRTGFRSGMTGASSAHGVGRAMSGFDLGSVIAEYRALRASVLRLWRESEPTPRPSDIEDISRFNESMDQSLAEAVRSYTEEVETVREALSAKEEARLEAERARREAEFANRAKDMFLATLSHELRTPLNAIVGWLTILSREDADLKHLQEGLKIIGRNTKAQVQLIDDLLDVSRIVSGKLHVDIKPCELAEVIHASVNVTRAAADARGITLDVRLDPSASAVSCDSVRIQQVVWNLVSNAIKFTPKGGQVRVRLSREQSGVQIQVSDTGQGISRDLLPHVFDRFRQADSSMRRKFAGLGLGLSIVKYIVEAHGGTIEVTSPGEGRGSTFTVRLPILEGQTGAKSGEAESGGRRDEEETAHSVQIPNLLSLRRIDGVHVLIVDDQADACRALAMLLELAGATVVTASSAREALERLSKARTDVLVSDLAMPEQDGFDLIRHVRHVLGHEPGDLPAIAVSACVQQDDARSSLLAGFQVHLPKPVDVHVLISVIARLSRPID